MVIKQTADREFKVAGGIVGRGFTDDILSSYLLRKPAMSLMSEAIADFSGVAFWTSEAIQPMILFQCMLFVKIDCNDLADYFKYELAPYPLTLFVNTETWKIVK